MKSFTVAFSLVMILALPLLANTIVVDPGGGGDATTIQEGINLASFGDEVLVVPDTYYENLIMESGIALRSMSGPEVTIVDGAGSRCIECSQCSQGTVIDGFTLRNAGGGSAGGVVTFHAQCPPSFQLS